MVDNLASAVIETLFDNPLPRNELSKLLNIGKTELERILGRLEATGAIYQIGYRWFVSTKLIIRREFFKVMSLDEPPENEFGKFIEEYAAARYAGAKPNATKRQAWWLAKQNAVEGGT